MVAAFRVFVSTTSDIRDRECKIARILGVMMYMQIGERKTFCNSASLLPSPSLCSVLRHSQIKTHSLRKGWQDLWDYLFLLKKKGLKYR
jgi:hypothetical protein